MPTTAIVDGIYCILTTAHPRRCCSTKQQAYERASKPGSDLSFTVYPTRSTSNLDANYDHPRRVQGCNKRISCIYWAGSPQQICNSFAHGPKRPISGPSAHQSVLECFVADGGRIEVLHLVSKQWRDAAVGYSKPDYDAPGPVVSPWSRHEWSPARLPRCCSRSSMRSYSYFPEPRHGHRRRRSYLHWESRSPSHITTSDSY